MDWLSLGYFGLFLACFFAATILPFSSEAIFTAAILSPMDPLLALVFATLGNWLGGMSSYWLGWLGNLDQIKKWLSVSEQKIEVWKRYATQYGYWLAVLCWLPFIGDVIAIALGFFRVNLILSAFFMLVGKMLRYMVVMYLAQVLFN